MAEHWHLDKRLNVSHLITTLVFLAGVFTWGANVEERIGDNAAEIKHGREIQQLQNEQVNQSIEDIKEQGKEINKKLDRLIERRNGNAGK